MHRITLAIVILAIAPPFGIADTMLTLDVPQNNQVENTIDGGTHQFISDEPIPSSSISTNRCTSSQRNNDRLWLVDTRSLTTRVCNAPLDNPPFRVSALRRNGSTSQASVDSMLESVSSDRPVLIQIHGNRMTDSLARERGVFVYNEVAPYLNGSPVDFLVFSWPSDKEGILLRDGREKAERTDVEGLYLGWLLRELSDRNVTIGVIGFSFGGRIATGALHAIAGGRLGGRSLPGEHRVGMNVNVGLIAPALEDDWLRSGNYHGMATKNIQEMSIFFNRRDAVLKRYWLLDRVRDGIALGFTGPRGLAPRFDGTPVPLVSRDCSPSLGIRHDEKKYYVESCRAGVQMARLFSNKQ